MKTIKFIVDDGCAGCEQSFDLDSILKVKDNHNGTTCIITKDGWVDVMHSIIYVNKVIKETMQ